MMSNLKAPNLGGSNLGKGPYNGFSPKQTVNNYKDSQQVMTRRIVVDSWNTAYATGNVNDRNRVTTPFRAVNNSGDFLGRVNYSCGGSNQINDKYPGIKGRIGSLLSKCDGTGIPASICNTRFVADSSDYAAYKRQKAVNQTYNDLSNGGDDHHGSYVDLMAVRRR
jgi:hypothetical protein